MMPLYRRLTLMSSASLISYYYSNKWSSINSNSISNNCNSNNIFISSFSPLSSNWSFDIRNKLESRCDNDIKSKKIEVTAENADKLPILIAGQASRRLAENISQELGVELAKTHVRNFTDG